MAGKKKQERRRHSDELKARVVARAQSVGATQAGREFDLAGTLAAKWAEAARITLPKFKYARGRGVVRVEDDGPATSAPQPRSGPETWSRKSQYTVEERTRIGAEARAEGRKVVAKRYGLPISTIKNWMNTPPSRQSLAERQAAERQAASPPSGNLVADTPEYRALVLRVLRGEHPVDVAATTDVSEAHVYTMMRQLGPAVATEHGLTYELGRRYGRSQKAKRKLEADGAARTNGAQSNGSSMTTLLSRPEPPQESGRRRNGQQPLFSEPEPQRVQAVPVDDAESARQQAIDEMRDSVTRQALKERDALKTVFEMFFREKLDR